MSLGLSFHCRTGSMRRIVNRAFTPKRIDAWEDRAREVVAAQLAIVRVETHEQARYRLLLEVARMLGQHREHHRHGGAGGVTGHPRGAPVLEHQLEPPA